MRTSFLELEITGKCQLHCVHCYAESGPTKGHGTMTTPDWMNIIDQAVQAGVEEVQFIGGEPSQHPDYTTLLQHAIDAGLKVQVYSNLVAVREDWWDIYQCPSVRLATSYYSDDPGEHEAVTGRKGSHAKTRANIAEAVRREIPIRVGIVKTLEHQRVEEARTELQALGVDRVGPADEMRGVGRGTTTLPSTAELCGRCGDGRAAIQPNGDVSPCVLSRWMSAGNVRQQPLAEVLTGEPMRRLVETIPKRGGETACKPNSDGNDCQPAETTWCPPSDN